MTVISSQEFAANQNMYFNMAINQDVCIKRDEGMFHIRYTPVAETNGKKHKYKQPDADFYRAISMDELLIGVKEDLREIFQSEKK